MKMPIEERFMRHVMPEPNSGCWLWMGCVAKTGYGVFQHVWNRSELAHRSAYKIFVGEIPARKHLDHKCRVTSCVNPAHLEPVTPRENTLRGISPPAKFAKQTHCKHGHEMTPENTIAVGIYERRLCRTCRKAIWQASNAKRRAKQSVQALR